MNETQKTQPLLTESTSAHLAAELASVAPAPDPIVEQSEAWQRDAAMAERVKEALGTTAVDPISASQRPNHLRRRAGQRDY